MASTSSLYRGQTFKNFTEFSKVFQSHCKEFGQRYSESGCPVQEINCLIQDRSLLFKEDFVFSSVTYKCVQHGSYIPFPWSSGVPQSAQGQVNCSAGLSLTAIRSKDVMEITSLNLNHNHPSAYLFNCNSCQEKFFRLKELKEHYPSCSVRKKTGTEFNTDCTCSGCEEKYCSLKDLEVHKLQCSRTRNSDIGYQLTENETKKISPLKVHETKDVNVQEQDHPGLPHFLDLPNKLVGDEANKSATAEVLSVDALKDRTSGFEIDILIKEEVDDQSYSLSLNLPCSEHNTNSDNLLMKEKEEEREETKEVHEEGCDRALPTETESLNEAGAREKHNNNNTTLDDTSHVKKTEGKFKKRKGRMERDNGNHCCRKLTKLLPKSPNIPICSENKEQQQNVSSPRVEEVFFTKPRSGVSLPGTNSALTPAPRNAILPSSQSVSPSINYLYPNSNPALQLQVPPVASPNLLPTSPFAPFVMGNASFQLRNQPSIIGANTLPLVTPLLNTGTVINPSQALSSLAPSLLTIPSPQNASTGSNSKGIHTHLLAPGQNMSAGQVNTGIMITTPANPAPLVPQAPTAATSSKVSVTPSNPGIQTSLLTPGQNLNVSQDKFLTVGPLMNAGLPEVDGIKIQNCVPMMPGAVPNPFAGMQTLTTPVSETLIPLVLGNQVVFMKQPILTSSGLPIVSSSLPLTSLSSSTTPTSSSISVVSGKTGNVVTSSLTRPPPPLLLAAPVRFHNAQSSPVISTVSLSSSVALTSSTHLTTLPSSHTETSTINASKGREKNVTPRASLLAKDVAITWWMNRRRFGRGRRKASEKMREVTDRSEGQNEKYTGSAEKQILPKPSPETALNKDTTASKEKAWEIETEQSAPSTSAMSSIVSHNCDNIQPNGISPLGVTQSIQPTAVMSSVNLPVQQNTVSFFPWHIPESLPGSTSFYRNRMNSHKSGTSGKPGSQNSVVRSIAKPRPILLDSNETRCPQLLGPLPMVRGNHATPQLPSSSAMGLNIFSNNVSILPKASESNNIIPPSKIMGEESHQNINKIQTKNMDMCSNSAGELANNLEKVPTPSTSLPKEVSIIEGSEMNKDKWDKRNGSSKNQTDESALFVGPFNREEFSNILSDPERLKTYVDTFPDGVEIGSKVLALPIKMNSKDGKVSDCPNMTDYAGKEPSIVKENDLVKIIDKSCKVLSNPVPILPSRPTFLSSTPNPRAIQPKPTTVGEQIASIDCETSPVDFDNEDEKLPKVSCDATDELSTQGGKIISSKVKKYKHRKQNKKFLSQKRKEELKKSEKPFQICSERHQLSECLKSPAELDDSDQSPDNDLLKLSFYGDVTLLHKAVQKTSVVLEKLPDASLPKSCNGWQMDLDRADNCQASKFQSKHKRKCKRSSKSRLSHNLWCSDSDSNENSCQDPPQLESSKDCRNRRIERKRKWRKMPGKHMPVKASVSLADAELDCADSNPAPIQRRSNRIGSKPKVDYVNFETKAFVDLDADSESGEGGCCEISLEAECCGEETDKYTNSSLEEANSGSDTEGVTNETQRTNKDCKREPDTNIVKNKENRALFSPSKENNENVKKMDSSSSKSDLSSSSRPLIICTDTSLSNHSLSTAPTDVDCNNSSIKVDDDEMGVVDSTNDEMIESQETQSVHYSSESDSDMFTDEQQHLTMKEKMKVMRKLNNEVTMFFVRHSHLFETVYEKDNLSDENEERHLCKVCKAFKTNGLYCLRKHLEKHLNGSLKCPSCQFEAWSEGQLTNHRC